MHGTYLITLYQDKDAVKSLGARWDPARRQWYVPDGLDLTPFLPWLPADLELPEHSAVAPALVLTEEEPPLQPPGGSLTLSQLLYCVERTVADVFVEGLWTTVEVVDVRSSGGHTYLELSERDDLGTVTAKAKATLWASRAARLLPEFERDTGAQLGPGIKLLVRARPVFKSQYGFSLDIDAIDPGYTLGDLEARKRDIRERLQHEGLWHANHALPEPWDYDHVLVIAPEGGAGLQDFQVEAHRLQAHGVCEFIYVFSRFQGEGAAAQIRHELLAALEHISCNHPWLPDAVVIIRGGGAVNDLAWLNDYELARAVCELGIPVFTGIGHERDHTVLDEVAHTRFDTPSKVIAGIERTLLQRVQQARALWTDIHHHATRQLEAARQDVQQQLASVQAETRHQLQQARRNVPALMHSVETDARRTLQAAREHSQALVREITGQGPAQTLQRGFALVRDAEGRAVTSAHAPGGHVTITFRDGQRAATLDATPTSTP